jgi:hypothetical protein
MKLQRWEEIHLGVLKLFLKRLLDPEGYQRSFKQAVGTSCRNELSLVNSNMRF